MESEQAPDGEGQRNLACCSPRACKELDTTEWLNNESPIGNKVQLSSSWKELKKTKIGWSGLGFLIHQNVSQNLLHLCMYQLSIWG